MLPEDTLNLDNCNQRLYDTTGLFQEHWKTNITFAYNNVKNRFFIDSSIVQFCNEDFTAIYPVKKRLNSGFGYRSGRFHKGIDIHLKAGDSVFASMDGIVRYSQYNNGGYGHLIIIRHFNGLETYYAHLTERYKKINDTVKAGELLGTGGNSGAKHSGPHLHFEVRIEDHPINPELIFDTDSYELKVDELTLNNSVFQPKNGSKNSSFNIQNENLKSHYSNNKTYKVKAGDSFYSIAIFHSTSIEKIKKLNGIQSDLIHPGDILKIP